MTNENQSQYTNEELAKYLKETQEAVLTTGSVIGRFLAVLIAYGIIDKTDRQYIIGKMSEEDYIQHNKESNDIVNMFKQMFDMATPKKKSEDTNEDKD